MKELKKTITTETIVGYEAEDGTVFSSREECQKYEQSAKNVIRKLAADLRIRAWDLDSLYPQYGYDDELFVWYIRDAEHLRIINQYLRDICDYFDYIPAEYIGNRVAVVVDENCGHAFFIGTYSEILTRFTSQLNKLFADPKPTT